MRVMNTGRIVGLILVASLGARMATPAPGAAPPTWEAPAVDLLGDPLPRGALARMGTLRLRHGGLVSAVVYAPEGSFVASAGYDRTVRLWDPKTGKQRACLRDQPGNVYCLALSPDGRTLASAGLDGVIRLWDVKSGQVNENPRRLTGHTESVHALFFSPDGKSLVSGGWDGGIRVWDVARANEVRFFGAAKGRVRSLALAPGGKEMASSHIVGEFGKTVSSIQLWSFPDGKHLRELAGGQKTIYRIAYSPDGQLLASGGDDGAKVWELASGSQLVNLRQTKTYTPCVIFAPDGRSLFGGGAGFLTQWRLPSGNPMRSLDVGNSYTYAAALSPDGKTLATAATRWVGLWDVATGSPRQAFVGHEGEVSALAFTPDGKELVTGGLGSNIFRWDAATGRNLGQMPGPQRSWNSTLVLSPDGKTLAAFGNNLAVVLLDAKTGKPRTTFTRHLPPRVSGMTQMNVALAPDGKTVFSSAHGIDHHIRRWDADTGKETLAIDVGQEHTLGLALSPDGKTLYSASRTGPVHVWDADTGKQLRQIGTQGQGSSGLRLSPDGRYLAAALFYRLAVWDAATGKELYALPRPQGYSSSLAFSPDSRTLAVVGQQDDRTRFYELASGQLRLELAYPGGQVHSLAFSPDGSRLATGSSDTTALAWDFRALPLLNEAKPSQLSSQHLDELLAGLADPDAKVAFRAVCALARAPGQATAVLARRINPGDPKLIAKLIERLGDEEFEVREKAARGLTALGTAAESALRKAAAGHADVDVRLRAGVILRALVGPADTLRLRGLRALEVLEMIGTPQARRLVADLARGPVEVELTQEAKKTLHRMQALARPKK